MKARIVQRVEINWRGKFEVIPIEDAEELCRALISALAVTRMTTGEDEAVSIMIKSEVCREFGVTMHQIDSRCSEQSHRLPFHHFGFIVIPPFAQASLSALSLSLIC